MNYILSKHAKDQSKARNVPIEIIDWVINFPDQIIEEEEFGQKKYQSLITFSDKKTYLVVVPVNVDKEPAVVKTVYRTTKLDKYYESQVWPWSRYTIYSTDR